MPLLLDPAELWVGKPSRLLNAGDRKPVALADAITVFEGDPPLTIPVLANDFDREGPVTLVSAFAALGQATADVSGTVTYEPPAGITGFDTIVYEIADAQDQRATAQVSVTIEPAELNLAVTPANTFLATAANGAIDITVTDPASLAGSYTADLNALSAGPVNLIPPGVTGVAAEGEMLKAEPGLWISDATGGSPTQSWQWQRGGIDIVGATSDSHILTAVDSGQPVVAVETLSDAFGTREAPTAAMFFQNGFTPGADPGLIAWWDADDAATLSLDAGGAVQSWSDLVSGRQKTQSNANRTPISGTRSLGGRNVIDFDGGDFLESTLVLPASGVVAFHAVIDIDAVASQYAAIFAVDAVNDFQIDAGADTQFDGRVSVSGIGVGATLSGGPFAGPLIISAMFDATGTGQAEFFIAGQSRATMALTSQIDVNAAFHLMTNRSKNAFIDGAVGEVVVTESVDNRGDYQSYLTTKWGIA